MSNIPHIAAAAAIVAPLAHAVADGAVWNISYRRVGGLRFLKIGRLCISWCVCASYRPLNTRA